MGKILQPPHYVSYSYFKILDGKKTCFWSLCLQYAWIWVYQGADVGNFPGGGDIHSIPPPPRLSSSEGVGRILNEYPPLENFLHPPLCTLKSMHIEDIMIKNKFLCHPEFWNTSKTHNDIKFGKEVKVIIVNNELPSQGRIWGGKRRFWSQGGGGYESTPPEGEVIFWLNH